ncbi:MAG: XRE family transcriptional regulator [Clostridia bacterium]|nr:XRE family transcriptional regulator [Clostridia bacterium]
MGRASKRENKNRYQLIREELGLSREKASELLESIMPERIEKIETEKSLPHPDEVLTIAEKYKRPSLCNYYCSNQCPIGKQYVPEVKVKELSSIVLEMLASLNSVNGKRDRLIEITADGRIDTEEIDDFIHIQDELERISITVETLQLWAEKMLANGVIDRKKYEERKNKGR